MSRPVVTVSQLPDRALKMPDTRQSDATMRSAGFVKLGVWTPTETLPMWRPVVAAVAAIERGIVRLQIALLELQPARR